MNQRDFDADLLVRYDDTGFLMPIPENEEGFADNPIRKLFERAEDFDVEDGEE